MYPIVARFGGIWDSVGIELEVESVGFNERKVQCQSYILIARSQFAGA